MIYKNILVTGGSGFIGSNILKKIHKLNLNIFSTYYKNNNFHKFKNVKYIKTNLEIEKNCVSICKNIDLVIMCAANSSGANIIAKNPLIHLVPNIRMNLNMLDSAHKNNVKKFLFISSNTVYPFTNKPVLESDVNYSIYEKYFIVGWMKLFSEIMCNMYSTKISKKMITIILRPGNLYGPYDKFDTEKSKVIPALIKRFIEKSNPIDVWGDGKDIKDFLYIDDFVNGLIRIVNNCNKHEIFNIASGRPTTINQIIKILKKLEGNKFTKINYILDKPTMIPLRLININKIKKKINFKQTTSLTIGLKKTILWYRKNIL